MKQLWTFYVRNGEAFKVKVQGNIPMVHDGGPRSLLKCLCTEAQADEIEEQMRSFGCEVDKHRPHEDEEQKGMREDVLTLLGDGVFPCEKCPGCSWFDPHLEGLCGAGMSTKDRLYAWEDDVIEERLSNPTFRRNWEDCPLKNRELLKSPGDLN